MVLALPLATAEAAVVGEKLSLLGSPGGLSESKVSAKEAEVEIELIICYSSAIYIKMLFREASRSMTFSDAMLFEY